jgi:hypothetical protein
MMNASEAPITKRTRFSLNEPVDHATPTAAAKAVIVSATMTLHSALKSIVSRSTFVVNVPSSRFRLKLISFLAQPRSLFLYKDPRKFVSKKRSRSLPTLPRCVLLRFSRT